jgi:hypothetical protein
MLNEETPMKTTDNDSIGFRCDTKLKQDLEALAAQSDMKLSQYILHILTWAVDTKAVAKIDRRIEHSDGKARDMAD